MPAADLAALAKEVKDGFAALTAAVVASQGSVDLEPLTAQVERVANALFVDPATDADGLAAITAAGNAQVETVIAEDTAGQMRVQVNADMP